MKILKFFKLNELKNSHKKHILFFEFWNATPHLQTALELAIKHSNLGESVTFLYGGHDVLYIERDINFKPSPLEPLRLLPEEAAIRLIKDKNIEFIIRLKLPKVLIKIPNFDTLDELIDFKYKSFLVGRSAASSLMFELGHSNPDPKKYSEIIEKIIYSGIQVYEHASSYFAKNNFDLVYVFNGRFCNQAAVAAAATNHEIKTLFHERGANKDLFFLEEFVPHDVLKVQRSLLNRWSEACVQNRANAENVATNFFLNSKAGKEIGWKSYIQKQKVNALPNLTKNKKIVSYFSSSDDEYAALRDLYVWKYWDNQYTAVLDLIKACQAVGNIDLHIRLHPNLQSKDPEDVQKWLDLRKISGINVIPPESEIDTYRLLEESDIVVVAGSTVGIESVYWGTPCINLGPASYSELDAAYRPKNFTDLVNLLSNESLIADRNKALPYGFHFNTFGHEFKTYNPIDLDSGTLYGQDITKMCRKIGILERIITTLRM